MQELLLHVLEVITEHVHSVALLLDLASDVLDEPPLFFDLSFKYISSC
jgi:hypothetical protein